MQLADQAAKRAQQGTELAVEPELSEAQARLIEQDDEEGAGDSLSSTFSLWGNDSDEEGEHDSNIITTASGRSSSVKHMASVTRAKAENMAGKEDRQRARSGAITSTTDATAAPSFLSLLSNAGSQSVASSTASPLPTGLDPDAEADLSETIQTAVPKVSSTESLTKAFPQEMQVARNRSSVRFEDTPSTERDNTRKDSKRQGSSGFGANVVKVWMDGGDSFSLPLALGSTVADLKKKVLRARPCLLCLFSLGSFHRMRKKWEVEDLY